MSDRIAVIGAGLAGLAAARALADAGRTVVVFEKSRGLGGRLATRRTSEGWRFNHGAPELTTTEPSRDLAPAFHELCARAAAEGQARPTPTGVVGVPGMSAVVGGLARGLDVRFGAEPRRIERAGGGWRVEGESFAVVVCTAPAPQTATLAADAPKVAEAARAAVMAPCWTLMAVWRAAPPVRLAAPFEAVGVDEAEGGREGARWVAHATADWSRAELEREREDVAAELARRLAEACGADPADLLFAQAHRWRYARVERPVGAPFVAQDGLVAAGDWLIGPLAADAHASGLAAAATLL